MIDYVDKVINIYFPKWVGIFYTGLAIILVPWIFNLAQNLPERHLVRHWDVMWVGFDVMMLATTAITIWFVIKKRIWVILSASVLATLFIVDAWFDILTAKPGSEQSQALFFGLLEIVLAVLTLRLVFIIMSRSTHQKKFRIITKDSRHKP